MYILGAGCVDRRNPPTTPANPSRVFDIGAPCGAPPGSAPRSGGRSRLGAHVMWNSRGKNPQSKIPDREIWDLSVSGEE